MKLQFFLIAFLASILYSTKAIFVKLGFQDTPLDALGLLAVRMIFSLPIYSAMAIWMYHIKKPNFTKIEWLEIIVIGLLGYYVSSLLDFEGLQYISAGLERVVLFIYPTLSVIFAQWFYKTKIFPFQWFAIALTYFGIIICFFSELQYVAFSMEWLKGVGLVALCGITFALYITFSGRVIPRVGSKSFATYGMIAASIGCLMHYSIVHGTLSDIPWNEDLLFFGFGISLIATIIPSYMVAYSISKIGSNNMAIISSVGPVSTIVQAHLILGEPMGWMQMIGTFIVVLGVIIIGTYKARTV